MSSSDEKISWTAPIKPSESLAGIRLGGSAAEFERVLKSYKVSAEDDTYQFPGSPLLMLKKVFDSDGEGGYLFSVKDEELTNWRLYFNSPDHTGANSRALCVLCRGWDIYAVKAFMFESVEIGGRPIHSYAGKLPGGIGLGDKVGELLLHTQLEFDHVEEWFYTEEKYGGLEVLGYGVDLNESPNQIITALTVIKHSPFSVT